MKMFIIDENIMFGLELHSSEIGAFLIWSFYLVSLTVVKLVNRNMQFLISFLFESLCVN
jgi:hypothetical protein